MRSRGSTFFWAILAVAVVVFATSPALAQSGRGTISGLVKDASGSVVPGVTVTATNRGTNAVTTAVTNADGLYSFRNLPLGTYSVGFSMSGFKPFTQDGIEVHLGDVLTVDHTLIVGGLADAVTVTADASMLGKGNAEIGTSLASDVVTDLPVDMSGGRSILQWAYLVTPSVEGEGKGNAWNSHVAGGAEFTNEVVIDGTSAVIQIGGWVGESSPPLEAVDEFKVQTSGIPAEYGRTGGGVFNFSLKSGTNKFRGSAVGAMRNEVFNANTWQNNYLKAVNPGDKQYDRAEDRQYMGSVSLGGPIIKDKTFFYAAFEDYRQSRFVLGGFGQTVPIPAFLDGDFSALLNTGAAPLGVDPAGNPIYPGAIRDPLTGNVFPGNIIPADRLSNTSRQIADMYRQGYAPMVDRLSENSALPYYNDPKFEQRQFSIKLTHQFSAKSQLTASFVHSKRPRTLVDSGGIWDPSDPDKFGGPLSRARTQIVSSPQLRLSHSYTFSSSVMNVVSFSWSQYYNPSIAGAANGGWPEKLGFGNTGAGTFPEINFGDAVNGVGETGIGYALNSYYRSNTFILGDSVSWVKGKHTFKFGGEVRYMQTTSAPNTGSLHFDFKPDQTRFMGQPWSNQTGFGFASFMLGAVDSGSQDTTGDLTGRRNYEALYAQDDFRLNDKLTVNLGLRWETTGPWTEKNGHWANYDNTAINPTTGVPGLLVFANDGSTSFEGPRDWTQFGPRIGLSYQATPRAVVRASYGLFYQGVGMDYWNGTPYGFSPGYRATNRVDPVGGGVPAFNWDNGYPGVPVEPTKDPNNIPWGPTTMSPQGLESGRIQQWNAGVDYELTRDLVVGVNYLGNTGTHLNSGLLQRNQPNMAAQSNLVKSGKEWNWVSDPASAADAGVPYPYPGFSNFAMMATAPFPQVAQTWGPLFYVGSPVGAQTYNALQVTLNKRRSHGVTAYASYTYSRSRGDVDTGFQENWYQSHVQDVNNLGMEANVINRFDQTHVLKGYVAWELPFGKGRRFANKDGLTDALLGGWELSLIFRYDSGIPIGFNSNSYIAGWSDFSYPIYVNRNANVPLGNNNFDPSKFDMANPANPSNRYFNPAAFSNPAYGEFGTGPGRFEELRTPGGAYEDLGIMKRFTVGPVRAQLRFELLNLFNRHYFGNPNTDIGSDLFGQMTTTGYSTPRQGQLSVRFDW
jgi:hypothetical protein